MPEAGDPAGGRIASLDLIRGVAVLGILAVNIAGFAGPSAATLTPHVPNPAGLLDEISFATVFVLFEGKMRALFTILFGASLVLFVERAEAAGRDGDVLQFRRLCWLMLFGLLHFFVLWWGDILFLYGFAGIAVLFLRALPIPAMTLGALLAFGLWHAAGTVESLPDLRAEEHVRTGTASGAEGASHASFLEAFRTRAAEELDEARLGFAEHIGLKLDEQALRPFEGLGSSLGETIPLMLIGVALLRTGFFAGAWPRRRMAVLAGGGLALGLAATLPLLAWLWARHFPPQAMNLALLYWTAPGHLAMALGYAAALVLAAPRLGRTRLGRRLAAAGRMAFTNYIATSAMMTALFYGWGLGLAGRHGHAALAAFVLAGWALMLAWSAPWLARFRQGPLEWLWRSLTERRVLPFRRPAPASANNSQ